MGPSTCVTGDNAHLLFKFAPDGWRQVLEKICELIVKNKGIRNVLPGIDLGRVGHFVNLWN